jgi:hypothetical protein
MKSVWHALEDFISSMDKLGSCKLRLRWQNDGDRTTLPSHKIKRPGHPLLGFDSDTIIVSGAWEVKHKRKEFDGLKDAAMKKLALKKLQLEYLLETENNLDVSHNAEVRSKLCPRCKNCLGLEVS